jgi:hypothetical protein
VDGQDPSQKGAVPAQNDWQAAKAWPAKKVTSMTVRVFMIGKRGREDLIDPNLMMGIVYL